MGKANLQGQPIQSRCVTKHNKQTAKHILRDLPRYTARVTQVMSQNGTIVQLVERQFGSIIKHRVIADQPPKTRTECLARSSHVLDRAELARLNRRGRMESQIIV